MISYSVSPYMNRFSNFSTLRIWNSNIREAVNQGHAEKALLLFCQMKRSGTAPNNSTIPFVAKACARISHFRNSQTIHAHVAKSSFQFNIFVQIAMVDMFIKCGQLENAYNVFVEMPKRDFASWNAMLLGFAQCGSIDRLLCLLRQVRLGGIHPDSVIVLLLVQAILHMKNPFFVNAIHFFGIRIGVHVDVSIANTLIAAYAKRSNLCSAELVFDEIDSGVKSVVSWNSIIAAYANFGKHVKASNCYKGMLEVGLSPYISTILNLLSSFVEPKAQFHGFLIHSHGVQLGCDSDVCVANTLISMYSK